MEKIQDKKEKKNNILEVFPCELFEKRLTMQYGFSGLNRAIEIAGLLKSRKDESILRSRMDNRRGNSEDIKIFSQYQFIISVYGHARIYRFTGSIKRESARKPSFHGGRSVRDQLHANELANGFFPGHVKHCGPHIL